MKVRAPFLNIRVLVMLCAVVQVLISCAKTGGVVVSDLQPPASADCLGGGANHYLWAFQSFIVSGSPDGSFAVRSIPMRQAQDHWNVLKFLEKGPCTDCVSVVGVANSGHGTKLFDVKITHPFSTPNLTGFDVRGIAMFRGSHSFPASGLTAPDRNAGDGELINADGYTALYNISTIGLGPGGLQGYLKGKFASPIGPNAALNGFKRYASPGATNTRNMFFAGDKLIQTFDIDMPDSTFILGYAVDACWVPPTKKPVTDPKSDFPPEANCPEPWKLAVSEEPGGAGLTDLGGLTQLVIDVYDHQGKASYSDPVVECPELFNGKVPAVWESSGSGFERFRATLPNAKLAPAGSYKVLVSVEDDENGPAPDWLDLTAYSVVTVEVQPGRWTRTWGGTQYDRALSVAGDSKGNVYVIGWFVGTVDFDPGPGVDNQTFDTGGAFLSKYDWSGKYVWTRSWGSSVTGKWAEGHGVVVDNSDNVAVCGFYIGPLDFDPGPSSSIMSGSGAFLSKFSPEGNLLWVDVWGARSADSVAADSQNCLYVTGRIPNQADLDPGPGEDKHTVAGYEDAYLSKFAPNGSYIWGKSWGGVDYSDPGDTGFSLCLDFEGRIWVAGGFFGTCDFDPGSGVDEHVCNSGVGAADAFLTGFSSAGDFVWARTWGGTVADTASCVACTPDSLWVCGDFRATVDFDPGNGEAQYTSLGASDAYVSSFDYDGKFQFVRVWGGTALDLAQSLVSDSSGSCFVCGAFMNETDFDPGPGTSVRVSNGVSDAYLVKFDSAGHFCWVGAWGGSGSDCSNRVARGVDCGIYVAGDYAGTVDFDPGGAADIHTSAGQLDVFLSRFSPDGIW